MKSSSETQQSVLIVRHGERLDEVDKRGWFKICTNDNWHDPPITQRGKEQSTTAGKRLHEYLSEIEMIKNSKLYTSPSLRTVGTAAKIGLEIERSEMILTPGLYQCSAAAKRDGLENLILSPSDTEQFISCSDSFPISERVHGTTSDTFMSSLNSIIDCATDDESFPIVVTHREGLYDLMEECNVPIRRLPYCVCMEFMRDRETKEWSFGKFIHPLN